MYKKLNGTRYHLDRKSKHVHKKIIALENTIVELYSQITALQNKRHTLDIKHHGS